jgi:HPt (histidine-containing phosphotransfer) domain-containing protein
LSQKSAGIRGARVLLVEDNLINQQVAVELLQDFRWQLRDVVVEIRSLLEQDKREEMRFLAHNIKGASANLGATDLRKSAARLEEAIKVGTRSEIEARLVKFEADRGIVLETIRGFVQADPPVAFEGREQVEPGKDSR